MSDNTNLEAFVAEAATVLLETESTLRKLAHEALLRSGMPEENGHGEALRLQQIGQQLSKLSQRSKALQNYLQNGLEAPPNG